MKQSLLFLSINFDLFFAVNVNKIYILEISGRVWDSGFESLWVYWASES